MMFGDIIYLTFAVVIVKISDAYNMSKLNNSQIIDLDFNQEQRTDMVTNTNFSKVTTTKLFIDKTLLIREIFCHKSLIISAPRYFGKSLNLNMLNLFLSNTKKIVDVTSAFNGTKIWSHFDFVQKHCCAYPVLFCTFHTFIEVINLETMVKSFKSILISLFYKHFYLNNSSKLNANQKQLFAKYIKRNANLTMDELKDGLKVLSRLMCLHHGKKVIVLIDDYDDKILNNIFDQHFKLQEREKEQLGITMDIVKFHSHVLCGLIKDTEHVERVIMTGILSINMCENFEVKDLKCIGFLRNTRFNQYFGFTKADLVKLILKFRLTRDERCELSEWYDVYHSRFGVVQVFNPLSVSEFLMVRSGNSFWADTKPFRMLGILPLLDNKQILDNFIQITNDTEINLKLKDKFSLQDLIVLKKTSENWWDNRTDTDLFFHLMLQMGYLTFSRKNESEVLAQDVVKVPNYEVRKELITFLFEYLDLTNNTEPNILDY